MYVLKIALIGALFFSSELLEAHMEFQYNPPKNFSLFLGKGTLYHPVTTTKPEAQAYFDQGLTLIYAFNHDAAFWSFKRATEIDPDFAMGYWGMALALGPNLNMAVTLDREKVAYDLSQKAVQLSSNVSDNEKSYIDALAVRYSKDDGADLAKLSLNYKEAMGKVVEKYPDDLDAATLYAESILDLNPWNQWDKDGNPREGTLELVTLLESILMRDPKHLGANHYYIHAVEASKHPEWALMSAERLRHLLPKSGHILHMPAHIYIQVGDYYSAERCNAEAVAADRAYIKEYGMAGFYPLHYLTHNLFFLSRIYALEGRYEDAMKTANELNAFLGPHIEDMPTSESLLATPILTAVHFHRWNEILTMPAPDPKLILNTAIWHFARSLAYSATEERSAALNEQKEFEKSRGSIKTDDMYGYNKAKNMLDVVNFILQAKFAEMNHDRPLAISLLKQGVALEDALLYNEPPDWMIPLRELLGGVYLRNKQFPEAEETFRELLQRHPRDGRALFGLMVSLKNQSRMTDAFWIEREYEKAWEHSSTLLNVDAL